MSLLGSAGFSVQHVVCGDRRKRRQRRKAPALRRVEPVVLGDSFAGANLAANVIRSAAPFDFRPSAPFYVIASSAVPKWKPRRQGEWGALACDADDLSLRPALEAVGAYRGAGFAAVFRDGWIARQAGGDRRKEFQLGLAILTHEAAHWLCRGVEGFRGRKWMNAQTSALTAYWNRPPEGDPARLHDGPWIRAALHLHHRVEAVAPVELADCQIAGERYGLSDAQQYRMALAGELQARRHESIGRILQSEPPAMFAGFWHEDSYRNRR